MVGNEESYYSVGKSINCTYIGANLLLGVDHIEMPFLLPLCLCISSGCQHFKPFTNWKDLCLLRGQLCFGMTTLFTDLIVLFNLAVAFFFLQ